MSSKLSTIFGDSSLGARPPAASRGWRAERAQDRAGHHDAERLDRVDVVSFGMLRGPIPASHIKFIEP
jgi:hypothetical protein